MNFNGLYRYRMGDAIKYVKHEGPEEITPAFELRYRRDVLLNRFGEKMIEQ